MSVGAGGWLRGESILVTKAWKKAALSMGVGQLMGQKQDWCEGKTTG